MLSAVGEPRPALVLVVLIGLPFGGSVTHTLALAAQEQVASPPDTLRLPSFDVTKMDPMLGEWIEAARERAQAAVDSSVVPADEKAAAIGNLGQIYRAFDVFDAAVACFELATRLAPEEPKWRYLRSTLQLELGAPESAASGLEQVLRLDPESLAARVYLGDAYLTLGRPEDARPLFEQASELEGGEAIARFGLGRVAAAEGDPNRAVEHFERALELQTDASVIHYPLGRELLKLGRRAEGERHLALRGQREVAFPDPFSQEVGDVKALVAFQVVHSMAAGQSTHAPEQILRFALSYLGDLQGTVDAFEEVLGRSDLQDTPARQRAILHYVTGGIALRQGLDADARKHLDRAVDLDAALPEPHLLLGNLLARERDFERAAAHYTSALEQLPDDTDLLLKRATALLNLGRTEDARKDLQRLLQAEPNHLQAAIRLAQIDEVEGRAADADARLRQLAERWKDGRERLAIERAWAELQRGRGDLHVAIEHLRRGLEAAPNEHAARVELARLLGGIGDLEGAEREFARVLRAWPTHSDALQGRVTTLVLLERYGDAAELLKEVLPRPETPPALSIVLVRVLAAAPDPDVRSPRRAIELARSLAERTREPLVIDSLAMAEAAMGNFVRATELQRQVVTQQRSVPGATARLELYRQHRPFLASRPEDLLPPPS